MPATPILAANMPKILIVDDDEDIRDSLITLLKEEGYEADGARSGLVALSAMTWGQFVPDVILLDQLMPAMNGDQFRTVLARHPEWSRIPIVLVTGDVVPHDVQHSVFGVLQKPFELDRLLAVLRRATAPRSAP